MKYLLDTAVFLWAAFSENACLSAGAIKTLEKSKNEIYLSSVSVWEISIKFSLGKLPLKTTPEKLVSEYAPQMDFQPLPITHDHSLQVVRLPFHHRDPFDRLLIAQAQVENLPIITSDAHFKKYGIETVW